MTQQPVYFNTTNESGAQLKLLTEKAASQEQLAEQVFKAHPDTFLTAEQVHEVLHVLGKLNKNVTPLTSIRRACSVLKKRNVVEITTHKTAGKYSHPIHYCRLIQGQAA